MPDPASASSPSSGPGFVLMAEGGEERGGGRAKTAVVMAVVGLVLVLSAKGVAALLGSGLVDFPTP